MKKATRRRAPAAAERIAVDYPGEGESVGSSRFSFQIDAPERGVEIAVDGEGWSSCRRADGRWWYDWSCAEPGRHQAVVRCEGPDGGEPSLRVCRFVVEPAAAPRAQGLAR